MQGAPVRDVIVHAASNSKLTNGQQRLAPSTPNLMEAEDSKSTAGLPRWFLGIGKRWRPRRGWGTAILSCAVR